MASPLSISFALPFADAITAARARNVLLPETYYRELPAVARSYAWTVSGLASLGQIHDVLDSLNTAMAQGTAFGEWQRVAAELDWGLSKPRMSLVFRMHAQTAYSAGHWRQFTEHRGARPFLLYSAVNDARTRPAHRAMSGHIAPIDDAIWKTWTPPCGWNCRCALISLTTEQAQARGYVADAAPPVQPDEGFGFHVLDAPMHYGAQLLTAAADIASEVVSAIALFLTRKPPPPDPLDSP